MINLLNSLFNDLMLSRITGSIKDSDAWISKGFVLNKLGKYAKQLASNKANEINP